MSLQRIIRTVAVMREQGQKAAERRKTENSDWDRENQARWQRTVALRTQNPPKTS